MTSLSSLLLSPAKSVGGQEGEEGGDVPTVAAPQGWGQPWQEPRQPRRPALSHPPSCSIAKCFSAEPMSWGEGGEASKLFPSENIQEV